MAAARLPRARRLALLGSRKRRKINSLCSLRFQNNCSKHVMCESSSVLVVDRTDPCPHRGVGAPPCRADSLRYAPDSSASCVPPSSEYCRPRSVLHLLPLPKEISGSPRPPGVRFPSSRSFFMCAKHPSGNHHPRCLATPAADTPLFTNVLRLLLVHFLCPIPFIFRSQQAFLSKF